jgi:hypothetical protein
MKIKNAKLGDAIANFECLRGLILDGDIALEAVKMKKALKDKFEEVEEAKKNVIEGLAEKGEDGKPKITVVEEGRHKFVNYSFGSSEVQAKCGEELAKIEAAESEIPNGTILSGRITMIKCTTEQLEALIMLTPQG